MMRIDVPGAREKRKRSKHQLPLFKKKKHLPDPTMYNVALIFQAEKMSDRSAKLVRRAEMK